MALLAVQTAMNFEDKKTIHPFFTKQPKNESVAHDEAAQRHADHVEGPTGAGDDEFEPTKSKKRRGRPGKKVTQELGKKTNGQQASLKRRTRARNDEEASIAQNGSSSNEGTEKLRQSEELDLAKPRKKRRKTASPTSSPLRAASGNDPVQAGNQLDWPQQLQREADLDLARQSVFQEAAPAIEDHQTTGTPQAALVAQLPTCEQATDPQRVGKPSAESIVASTPKKKIVKLNKNGKLLSSPTRISPDLNARGRPKRTRAAAVKEKRPGTIVIIKYGLNPTSRQHIGQKIDDILHNRRIPPPDVDIKKAPRKLAGPPKPTHPFFQCKNGVKEETVSQKLSQKATVPVSLSSPKKSAVTPGKIRAESRSHHLEACQPDVLPSFGRAKPLRHTGAPDAPWPSKELAHVRNLPDGELHYPSFTLPTVIELGKQQKLKGKANSVPQSDEVLSKLAGQLLSEKGFDGPKTLAAERNVRLPSRVLTTGVEIQNRLRALIHAPVALTGQDRGIHPAIEAHFDDIEHSLTPFDRGECEALSWVQKYAPASASQVLQSGKEIIVLRDWLIGLTVQGVKGTLQGSQSTDSKPPVKPPKKKKRKMEDDFIVFSEEEDGDELVEVSDGELYDPRETMLPRARSLKRLRISKNQNVVVISGPHGCGKSATVHAVAKELGFEVFEINSGSRRSGKDILAKVGDMSENHLVNHKQKSMEDPPAQISPEDADSERMDRAFEQDLQSGRQGTMTSFFQAATKKQKKPASKTNKKSPAKPKPTAQATLTTAQKPRSSQKQSLILFEEADVLFEEDQAFWAQVIRLAHQSKRPIIITCTQDESIAMDELPFGAILRLSPPPVTLATDYLLTLAAKEGHILDRKAVGDLYQSKNCDLRASIMELDFWCQMSVGDRKGGLEWLYQRWPPGKDVDEHGRLLRVASERTYQSGMGMVSYDILTTQDDVLFNKEESFTKSVWQDWCVDIEASQGLQEQSGGIVHDEHIPTDRLAQLAAWDRKLEAMSSADVYCRVGLPSYEHDFDEPTDPTLPPISDKERLNYTVDSRVLQVDMQSDFHVLDTDLAVQTALSAKHAFEDGRFKMASSPDPANYNQQLVRHILDQACAPKAPRPRFEYLDILASVPGKTSEVSLYPLTTSAFYQHLKVVTEDVAPYVRSIVSHELKLEAQRLRLSSLLSEGGTRKRPRTTRASRVALEGGVRQTKRKERWFDKELNRELVMATAGKAWSGLGTVAETDGSTRTGDTMGEDELAL
ncbi:P-loop containing nucleoside triphosphate hydrolase protein [Sporormia fimetaria CBS 119925]|uniref:P-loop containing nucleoside triphosphate hydrolase protein n=1 Tax=Sporormia fimetaria CBS 119925 TaxID=1340428 RepID=A0A6A6UY82_9PLEO|nr:P-loop containing nucleoside triphosphate hydrolase protein [Sporormia fimetaria CBS 119925]